MKILSQLGLAFALILAGLAPAAAQDVPGGSYLQSCNDARTHGNRLHASCRTAGGGYTRSSLTLPCDGDIANQNGYLVCSPRGYRPGGPGSRPPGYGYAPGGSYQSSCRNARMQGSVLVASCQATNGYYNQTSLNVNRCFQGTDIANINGQLACLNYR
jgi:hypothetical protein